MTLFLKSYLYEKRINKEKRLLINNNLVLIADRHIREFLYFVYIMPARATDSVRLFFFSKYFLKNFICFSLFLLWIAVYSERKKYNNFDLLKRSNRQMKCEWFLVKNCFYYFSVVCFFLFQRLCQYLKLLFFSLFLLTQLRIIQQYFLKETKPNQNECYVYWFLNEWMNEWRCFQNR